MIDVTYLHCFLEMGLKNSWAHVSIHVMNVTIRPSQRLGFLSGCHGNPFASTSRNSSHKEEILMWHHGADGAGDCDCLRRCRGALRWRKRALHMAEGAAAAYAGANRPEISTRASVWILSCDWQVDDIKSPCRHPWEGPGNGLLAVPALVH